MVGGNALKIIILAIITTRSLFLAIYRAKKLFLYLTIIVVLPTIECPRNPQSLKIKDFVSLFYVLIKKSWDRELLFDFKQV